MSSETEAPPSTDTPSGAAPPPPIPAEGSWSGDPADLPNWDAMPRRNRRRRRRGRYPVWLKYLAWSIGVAVLVTLIQIVVQAVRSDPRDAQAYAERQLRLSTLRPNERVIASASVWQRPPIDYFRATSGILVLTDAPATDSVHPIGGRLIYLGLQPRDALSPVDAPPTFDVRDWPVDTLVSLEPGRTLLYLAHALRLRSPNDRLTFGIPTTAEAHADSLREALERKYVALRAVGYARREQRRAKVRAERVAIFEGRRPWYHTVRRGEALASVAKMFNTTPEQVRALNQITGDRIRIGQKLLVKPWTKSPVPTPPGATPEYASGPPSPPAQSRAPPRAGVTRPTQSPKPIRR